MATFAIEKTKKKGKTVLTKKCKYASTADTDVMIGSYRCLHSCCAKSHTSTEVVCGFKRLWK